MRAILGQDAPDQDSDDADEGKEADDPDDRTAADAINTQDPVHLMRRSEVLRRSLIESTVPRRWQSDAQTPEMKLPFVTPVCGHGCRMIPDQTSISRSVKVIGPDGWFEKTVSQQEVRVAQNILRLLWDCFLLPFLFLLLRSVSSS